ncbi:cytochrome P450 [Nonomuraea sp. B10E15]|uniref:cytochrome P450 n=1 Tax=Nonomuraea sp. B10E15 TaxID=3153560 RepID=UPI00325D8E2A
MEQAVGRSDSVLNGCPVAGMPTPALLPTEFEHPLHPPRRLATLNREFPVSRLLYPSGEVGWLVTRHTDVRAVLADTRTFSSKNRARFFNPTSSRPSEHADRVSPAGAFISEDPPAHGFYRGRLAGYFTMRQMTALQPRIQEIVDQQLHEMVRGPRPADLVQAFAAPVPSLVICELIGVAPTDQALFQRVAATVFSLTANPDEAEAATDELREFMLELVRHKRANPDGALLSRLVADESGARPLTEQELVNICLLLLVAGYESTVNTLALGVLTLLRNPLQLRRLHADMSLVDNMVEELLRFLPITRIGLVRVTTRDTTLGGQEMKAGEPVVAAIVAANRDPNVFTDPDFLDITRDTRHHVSFGHGPHLCIGQQLARTQLRISFRALFERFPNLELAVPLERIRFRIDREIYGVHELPVTW